MISPSTEGERTAQRARDAGYVVRPIQLDDVGRIAPIHVQIWREAYASLLPADYLDGLDAGLFERRWRERLSAPLDPGTSQILGVNPASEIVAFGASGPSRDADPPVDWELWAINVLATEQGTGLADLLMSELVGSRDASLWVLDGNARARAFYRRHGFVPDGATRRHQPSGAPETRLVRTRSGKPEQSEQAGCGDQ